VVVGGGIAGACAAVILAERGLPVVLCEAADRLGGRLGAHPHVLPDGTGQWVDHGFHGFFRQYYNWRKILGRISPGPEPLLHPLGSYPVISATWPDEEFDRLPPAPPLSILALALRSPSLRMRDLVRADQSVGLSLLGFDAEQTYAHLDQISADQLLSALMERAAATGISAANAILAAHGHPTEPVWSVPPRGLLADRWAAEMRRGPAGTPGPAVPDRPARARKGLPWTPGST
jgi:glycine/D-amino acid oxidase-like deaminating enzyme